MGFTLQTLIITAVVVVIAIGVGLLFIALTSSSSEDLEDAGRSGIEGSCAPNELLDAVYVRRGIGGPNSQGGVESKAVGCKPHCATWEFVAAPSAGGEYKLGGTGEGSPIGGPDGKGGVFSSNIGCFAPCYWDVGTPYQVQGSPFELIGINLHKEGHQKSAPFTNPGSRLRYYNDNRPPDVYEIRLGVTYKRALELDPSHRNAQHSGTELGTELQSSIQKFGRNVGDIINRDGKPFFYNLGGTTQGWAEGVGVRNAPGTPLSSLQLSRNVNIPTVHTPNWVSNIIRGHSNLRSEWGFFNTVWEDEHWEIRADPKKEVCEIVYIPTDRLICSSANNSCLESNRADSTCPQTYSGQTHPEAGQNRCRIP